MEDITYKNNGFTIPELIEEIVNELLRLHPNVSKEIITNMLLVKCFQMFTMRRITFDESGKIKIPNWFALILLQSGGGKDRLNNDIDEFVFKGYHKWFQDEVNKLFEPYKPELFEEISNATIEGVVKWARTIEKYKFGNIFIKIPELGQYLKNASKQDIKFLNSFCEMYDCVIPTKLIKSESYSDNITDIPINILTYSDFTAFFSNIRNVFNAMLEAGLCRRFIFSFQKITRLVCSNLSDEEERNIYSELDDLGKKLFDIFLQTQPNSCYKLLPEAKTLLCKYKKRIYNIYNEMDDNPLQQKEILSREYKALKLSCVYACLNHPLELEIKVLDLKQAIYTVEFLSKDFKKFTTYVPRIDDKYEQAYNYLKQHYGTAFTKTHLVNTFSKNIGFSRRKLRTEFGDFMHNIEDIARDNGYCLRIDSSSLKHGTYYYLVRQKDPRIEEEVVSVKDIVDEKHLTQMGYSNFTIDFQAEFCS